MQQQILFKKLTPLKPKPKPKRETSIQFYIKQAEERKRKAPIKIHFKQNLKIPLPPETPQISQRVTRVQKHYFEMNVEKMGCSSCDCGECGKDSRFQKKVFKLYPFKGTRHQHQKMIRRRFRKFVICIQFIIRYKIVQQIRERQRNRMKKALKPTQMEHRISALSSLLCQAAKELKHQQPQQSQHQQQQHMENEQEDSDEEYYHLKPRENIVKKKKSLSNTISPKQKQQHSRSLLYFIRECKHPINLYISKRVSLSPQVSQLPPLSSVHNYSHRKNISCYSKKS